MLKPVINVTPLIDVLLVLLIIFMVVAPLRPSSFKARIPAEQQKPDAEVRENPKSLIVTVGSDSSVMLNRESGLGSTADTGQLVDRLKAVFAERVANGDVSESFGDDQQRPFADRAERTVFIKAPRSIAYGEVAKIVDAVKFAGAYPVSLQIDGLDRQAVR